MDKKEIYVRKIINISDSPDAINKANIHKASLQDRTYQETIKLLKEGKRPKEKSPYTRSWDELCVVDDLILKGERIVIPDTEEETGKGNIREHLLDIAHEGHPGSTVMKKYMRSRVWFPKMDKSIDEMVAGCLPCQASTNTKHRDPLTPSTPPEQPWVNLAADHWGPTPNGKYLLVVIDELSRYPEVAIVNSTSAEANIEAFDNIFTRHGYCKSLKTDRGPPFNGNEYHLLQKYFTWAGIKHIRTQSAEDPEANGLAEAFMKHCAKIWHTATIERKNPRAELNKHLQMVRGTPHPTTGKQPAEMLFGRKFQTRLPHHQDTTNTRKDIEEAREKEIVEKHKQKSYKDQKSFVKPHTIQIGDTVLLSQKKTKTQPPYDPDPFTVTEVKGHQITANRGHKTLTRDAQKWKRIRPRTKPDYETRRQKAWIKSDEEDELLWFEENTHIKQTPHTDVYDRPHIGGRPHINERQNVDERPHLNDGPR